MAKHQFASNIFKTRSISRSTIYNWDDLVGEYKSVGCPENREVVGTLFMIGGTCSLMSITQNMRKVFWARTTSGATTHVADLLSLSPLKTQLRVYFLRADQQYSSQSRSIFCL